MSASVSPFALNLRRPNPDPTVERFSLTQKSNTEEGLSRRPETPLEEIGMNAKRPVPRSETDGPNQTRAIIFPHLDARDPLIRYCENVGGLPIMMVVVFRSLYGPKFTFGFMGVAVIFVDA